MNKPHNQAIFFHQETLVYDNLSQQVIFPLDTLASEYPTDSQFHIGLFQEQPLYAVYIEPHQLLTQPQLDLIPVRKMLTVATDMPLCATICRAKQLLHWHRRSLFCGQCGAHTQLNALERCKYCETCQTNFYPQTAPAIIVAIQRDEDILLARSPHFAPNLYSALAGFVEAGESCEATLAREVFEEVRLTVTNIRYFASQSWPFPNSFMLGFTADYASGEIEINPDEIEDAKWFNRHNLPPLPPPYSIARRLIEHSINSRS